MDNLQNKTTILYGKPVADSIKQSVKQEISSLGILPRLVIVKTSNDPASSAYIKGKVKDCEECGIACNVVDASECKDKDAFISKLIILQNNNICGYETPANGVIVQLPLNDYLKPFTKEIIENYINSDQDVDCFAPINIYKLSTGEYNFAPCTPAGIIELLKYYNIPIAGKNVTIIGRSNLVGKPLATMLTNEDATVTLCHSKTSSLKSHTVSSDIIISAVGKEKLITEELIPNVVGNDVAKCTIIDVGINRNSDGKLCGDCDFENLKGKVKAITPVPGGVGLMTRAMLMKNVLKAYKLQNGIK